MKIKCFTLCLILVLAISGCGTSLKQNVSTSPSETTTDWTKEDGKRLENVISSSTIKLQNATYRMYYTAESGIKSATSPDGLNFTIEDDFRISPGEEGDPDSVSATNPEVVILPDRTYRIYYTGYDGTYRKICSATSADGLLWAKEGVRIDSEGAPDNNIADVPTVIRLDDGSYRMYYVYDWYGDNSIRGATSADGLVWTKFDVTGFSQDDMDPEVILLANGNLKLFYATPATQTSQEPMYIYSATSSDGIDWTKDEGARIIPTKAAEGDLVGDPDIVAINGTRYRMYYYGMIGDHSDILSALSP